MTHIKHNGNNMNFQEAAKSANHAQRNWLDEPMSMAHAKEFIEIS